MWGSGDICVQASERLKMSAKDDRSGLPRPCHASAHSNRIIPEIYLIGDRAKNPSIQTVLREAGYRSPAR
jgi:hypothetical protein